MPARSQAFSDKRVSALRLNSLWFFQLSIDDIPQNPVCDAINVVEVLDEDSRVEGCFKNKKVFIEELSSDQTILIASHI